MKKNIMAIIATSVILLSLITPAILLQSAFAADPTGWYTTINGVLESDYYSLYPYAAESLEVGLSKFGELINSNTNVGLEYADARDPFAAPVGSSVDESKLPKKVWINGWYIDIRYVHEDWGPRCVWAGALFADKSDYGKNWIRVDNDYTYPPYLPRYEYEESFDDKGLELDENLQPISGLTNGGRKTNGTAVTEPITILYDGPRLFVAKSETHIYDWNEDTDDVLHLVDVVLTIMFNKVKKEVVVLKDVKFIEQAKYVIADLPVTTPGNSSISIPMAILVQFSNREEWDLGAKGVTGTMDYSSYVHFYTEGTAANDTASEGQSTVYNNDWTMLTTLPAGVTYGGVVINAHGPEPGDSGTYDVAQIISNDKAYVGWHAFWPSLSDWSADAARSSVKTWNRAMTADDPHWIDAYTSSEPFLSPLIVGEWYFILADREEGYDGINVDKQFRGVSVYGVTDLNDGDDANMGAGHSNVLDTEVLYQLDEVFNPWDLNDAVHKKAGRFVEFKPSGLTSWTTSAENVPVIVVSDEEWDDYCTFAERVENLATGEVLSRDDYSVTQNADGTMTLTGLPSAKCKILYSTYGMYVTSEDNENNTLGGVPDYDMDAYIFSYDSRHPIEFNIFTPAFETAQYGYMAKLKIEAEDVDFELGEIDAVYLNGELVGMLSGGNELLSTSEFNVPADFLDVSGVQLVQIFVSCDPDEPLPLTIDPDNSTTWPIVTTDWAVTVNLGKLVFQPKYEWVVVGRDAQTVDSAGAALVSAAFKNKQIEIGLGGADMYNSEVTMQMPWVMAKFGTGNTRADYYYGGTDYRTALRDDWCYAGTVSGDEVPVASSNMIGVGGPIANLLAYYGNDFVQAIFGLDAFTDYAAWENMIIPLTCWDITKTQAYKSSSTTGYAVISTYKDINGTVLFLVWGYNGIDTFYVSKWFHEEGIYQLQEAPDGLTSIIVKIVYESTSEGYKPTSYSVVECLGTISETLWVHGIETKGGFHDP